MYKQTHTIDASWLYKDGGRHKNAVPYKRANKHKSDYLALTATDDY